MFFKVQIGLCKDKTIAMKYCQHFWKLRRNNKYLWSINSQKLGRFRDLSKIITLITLESVVQTTGFICGFLIQLSPHPAPSPNPIPYTITIIEKQSHPSMHSSFEKIWPIKGRLTGGWIAGQIWQKITPIFGTNHSPRPSVAV